MRLIVGLAILLGGVAILIISAAGPSPLGALVGLVLGFIGFSIAET